jgi:uncharacterized protein (DUF1800 family)
MRSSKLFRKGRKLRCRLLEIFGLAWMISSLVIAPLDGIGRQARKAASPSTPDFANWDVPLTPDEKILQLLSRATFGPRPGDVERVRQQGIEAFLDEQLHPERRDDSWVEARVAKLPTLSMSAEELLENFPEPRQTSQRSPQDGQRQSQPSPKAPQPPNAMSMATGMGTSEMQGPRRVIMELAQEEVLRAAYTNRQLQEVMVQFWMNHFNIFAPKGADKWLVTSFERDTIRPRSLGKFEDLLVATAKSPAMLFYLDNWMSSTPNPTHAGDRLRRSAPQGGRAGSTSGPFGRRGLFGLWRRFGTPSDTRTATPRSQQNRNPRPNNRGLNENYGRELMELHTLGVNGGYTQQDVVEVARCLTGWTIDRPRQGGEFKFEPRMHDFESKVVLDHKISAGHGMEDGLRVLHLLAHHPSTARFISLKLCRRFVADDPPQALVDRASQTFLHTEGDIRAVLKTILTSPEFYSQAAYRAKVKSPLELVASSIRALQAKTDAGVPLLQLIARMGQPMFQYQAPTGFPDRASTWINSSALLMRMNFATRLASNNIEGTQIDWTEFDSDNGSGSADTVLARLDQQLLEGSLTPQTRETILKQFSGWSEPRAVAAGNKLGSDAAGSSADSGRFALAGEALSKRPARELAPMVAALVLASPEFQKR